MRPRSPPFASKYGLAAGSGDQGVAALDGAKQAAFMDAYRALYTRASLRLYVDHIDYIAKRAGVDHLGIGSERADGLRGYSTLIAALRTLLPAWNDWRCRRQRGWRGSAPRSVCSSFSVVRLYGWVPAAVQHRRTRERQRAATLSPSMPRRAARIPRRAQPLWPCR